MKGKSIFATIAGLAVIALGVTGFLSGTFTPKSVALAARQEAMQTLGKSIARLRPKCKVLVLSNPFTKNSSLLNKAAQFERAGLRGLRKGLGPDSPITVVFPEIKPQYFSDPQSVSIPPDSKTPLSFLINPGAVEKLADANPECSVLVSLIGLPAGVGEGKIWNAADTRSFALLLPDLRLIGPAQMAVEAYERGKILAVVAEDAFQPGKPLIVTRNNVREVLQRQPQALGF